MVSDEIIQKWEDAIPLLQWLEQADDQYIAKEQTVERCTKLKEVALSPDKKTIRNAAISRIIILLVIFNFATLPLLPILKKLENQDKMQLIALVGLIVAVALIYPIIKKMTKNSLLKKGKKQAAALDIEIDNAELVIEGLVNDYRAFMSLNECKIDFIPENYRNSYAAESIYYIFKNGRADSLKEALNVFEDDEHRRRMENGQQAMMDKQRELEYRVEDAEYRASQAETAAFWATVNSNRYRE